MRKLNVAVFVKGSPGAIITGDRRNMGFWSYAVPEFTWKMFSHGGGDEDLSKFKDYDFIFHEDCGYCRYTNKQSGPPVVYLDLESTMGQDKHDVRIAQAKQADLVLVDWTPLENMRPAGKKIIRFPYCVNDAIFYPREKNCDIVWHAAVKKFGRELRYELSKELTRLSVKHGWSLRDHTLVPVEYAASMGAARVGCNQNRSTAIRAHRTFDTMASGAALVTGPTPFTDGDLMVEGVHYLTFHDNAKLEKHLVRLIDIGEWQSFAEQGYNLIMQNHTWAIRAAQLREIVNKEFGI